MLDYYASLYIRVLSRKLQGSMKLAKSCNGNSCIDEQRKGDLAHVVNVPINGYTVNDGSVAIFLYDTRKTTVITE